jgi:hypothetical protein
VVVCFPHLIHDSGQREQFFDKFVRSVGEIMANKKEIRKAKKMHNGGI